jgi:hypothetical protein
MNVTYETDYHAWTAQQAELLRQGRLAEIDVEHIAEELEDMGSSREQELESRLGILLAHLLKWAIQPDLRSNSWRYTIEEQRRRIERLLRKNPSLKSSLLSVVEEAYGDAILMAARETQLKKEIFPKQCNFSITWGEKLDLSLALMAQ